MYAGNLQVPAGNMYAKLQKLQKVGSALASRQRQDSNLYTLIEHEAPPFQSRYQLS